MIEKAKIRCILDSALLKLCEHGRISNSEKDDFINNFNESNLIIGIVGKMKAGKSSLVNAVVFNNNVLPSGSQPITVTLTEISYGESNHAEVELLSMDDINELKALANRTPANDLDVQLIKNANDVLKDLPANYEQLVEKGKITIPLCDLAEFVSSTGKLSSLAKSVKITVYDDALKGITIIDTPGFNDPITSRGETTKKCLGKCNVLLFVHTQNGYDQIDAALLGSQIEYAGISELIDVYNKVDLLHIPLSEWEDQLDYYTERRDEYLKKLSPESNVTAIMKDSSSLMTSSLMALCGQIPSKELTPFLKSSKSQFEEEYDELTDLEDNGITVEEKLIEISNIEQIISHIDRISKISANYLIEAPLLTLKGKLESVIKTVKEEIAKAESKIATLSEKVESAEREKANVSEFFDEIRSDILANNLTTDLLSEISSTFRALCNERSKQGTEEFNETNYPDTSFLSKGITKHNLGIYNLFVSDFENEIRNALESLKSSLRTKSLAFVKSLHLSMVNTHITQAQRKYFENSLSNSMNSTIDDINVLISSHAITELPYGNLNQWALLKKEFESDFDDDYFSEVLSPYRERAVILGEPSTMLPTLAALRSELLNSLSSTPEQKEREKKKEEEHLSKLNAELSDYEQTLSEIAKLIR